MYSVRCHFTKWKICYYSGIQEWAILSCTTFEYLFLKIQDFKKLAMPPKDEHNFFLHEKNAHKVYD